MEWEASKRNNSRKVEVVARGRTVALIFVVRKTDAFRPADEAGSERRESSTWWSSNGPTLTVASYYSTVDSKSRSDVQGKTIDWGCDVSM